MRGVALPPTVSAPAGVPTWPARAPEGEVLSIDGLAKRYETTWALQDLALHVRAGASKPEL